MKSVQFVEQLVTKLCNETKPILDIISPVEKQNIWYNKHEIKYFALDALKLNIDDMILSRQRQDRINNKKQKRLKSLPFSSIVETNKKNIQEKKYLVSSNEDNYDDNSDEHYYCESYEQSIERKKKRYYANKIILESQNVVTDNDLATISSRLSSWAKDKAILCAEYHEKFAAEN